jgi:hypothetical protein
MFKKKKPKFTQVTSLSKVRAQVREFIMDSQVPEAMEISERLGCPPISDELVEREEQESEKRVGRIDFLIPLLYGYSALFSEAFITSLSDSLVDPKTPMTPETKRLMHNLNHATKSMMEDVMAHLLVGSVSQLVDLEFLQVNKKGKR